MQVPRSIRSSVALLSVVVASACYGQYVPLGQDTGTTEASTSTTRGSTGLTSSVGSLDSSSTSGASSETSEATGETEAPTCTCDTVDILMVVDRRASLNQYLPAISGALLETAEVVAATLDNVCSYHIGVTTASIVPQNDAPCDGLGSLIRGGANCAALLDGRPYIMQDDPLVESMTCLLGAPYEYSSEIENSRPMAAMLEALSGASNEPGGCNEGFFRPDAPLVVIVVTDQDDNLPASADGYGSLNNPGEWAGALFVLQEGTVSRTGLAMIVGPDPAVDGCDAQPAVRLNEFAEPFSDELVQVVSICGGLRTLTDALNGVFGELVPATCEGVDGGG